MTNGSASDLAQHFQVGVDTLKRYPVLIVPPIAAHVVIFLLLLLVVGGTAGLGFLMGGLSGGLGGATAGGIAGLVLGGLVFMVLTILLSMIAAALVVVMAREGLAGREPDLASGWAGVQQRLGPVVVASLLVAAIVAALAAVSFGVLGAVAGFFLLYTLPAAALDGHGGPEALRRSVALVRDNLGVTVGLVVGFILVAVAAMLVSTVLHLVPVLGGLAAAVLHGVLVAYLTVVGVRVYLTLPRR
jgi:hypothetical protein